MQGLRCSIALLCGLLFTLAGCGGSSVETPKMDYSQAPDEEYVHVLAASGSLDSLKTALEQDPALLGARSVRDRTLLHTAALAGQNDVIRFLLEKGLNPNEQDDQGAVPSELALSEGHTSTVKLLTEAEASAGAPTN